MEKKKKKKKILELSITGEDYSSPNLLSPKHFLQGVGARGEVVYENKALR